MKPFRSVSCLHRGRVALHIIPTGNRASRGGPSRVDEAWDRPGLGCRRGPGIALHREVALDVDLRGLHVGVTQEVLDGDERDVRLEEMHRLGVAERVRSDAGPSETRERALGALHVLLQEVACAVTREALPVPVLDQRRGVIFAAPCRGEKVSHQPSGLRQQGRESFAPAFAEEPDKRWWSESDIARSQIQELLGARPGVVEESHEEVVAFPDLRRAVDLPD